MKLDRAAILAMEPGKELDALVDEYIMNDGYSFDLAYEHGECRYSTDIAAAWEVVEKFDKNTFNLNWLDGSNHYGLGWHCKLDNAHSHKCSTPPEAICKAALLAKLESEG